LPAQPALPKAAIVSRSAARVRGLAIFNLAIDSNLRGCDGVSIKVEDIAP
jgi:hypothetical protein